MMEWLLIIALSNEVDITPMATERECKVAALAIKKLKPITKVVCVKLTNSKRINNENSN